MKRTSAIVLAALALSAGCAKKEAPADAAGSATAASTATATAVPSAAPSATTDTAAVATASAANTDPNHVPVTVDYEEQAKKDVTAANVSSKLDELEKEIKAP